MRVVRSFGVMALVIASLLSVVWAAASAQQATPTVDPGAPPQGVEYPVAVHMGSCASPTPEAEITLANTIVAGSDIAEGTFIGVTPGQPTLVSSTSADITLDDLASQERVIAVHESEEAFGTLVACGTISGTKANGQLVISLPEVNGSGINGVAVLDENDDQTDIRVYVISPSAIPATPVPAS